MGTAQRPEELCASKYVEYLARPIPVLYGCFEVRPQRICTIVVFPNLPKALAALLRRSLLKLSSRHGQKVVPSLYPREDAHIRAYLFHAFKVQREALLQLGQRAKVGH